MNGASCLERSKELQLRHQEIQDLETEESDVNRDHELAQQTLREKHEKMILDLKTRLHEQLQQENEKYKK